MTAMRDGMWLLRAYVQRRLMSTSGGSLRMAAKKAADQPYKDPGFDLRNSLIEDRKHGSGVANFYKKIVFMVSVPLLLLGGWNGYRIHAHDHHIPRPDWHEYDHLRTRRSKFFFGDGNHTFFHHPAYDPIPGVGYEAPDPALEGHGGGHGGDHHKH